MSGSALSSSRRARELTRLADHPRVDLLVVGGGVTGTGVALDAAARGLSVVLAERSDVASGTSRWSSKLVHGGLRYLAHGDVGVARESAVERGRIMATLAPHLCRALPMVLPFAPGLDRRSRLEARAGLAAGDLLRLAAWTGRDRLPAARSLSAAQARAAVPSLREDVSGALLSFDGQLTDDARLVVAIARTAAAHGAVILTRCEAADLSGDGATLTDRITGSSIRVRARCVLNAAGVWAGGLVPGVELRPSRGTHLVLDASALPGLRAGLTVPVPGERARFVFALPVPGERRIYVGLTDEPADREEGVPDVPRPSPAETDFLLTTISSVLRVPLRAGDVAGSFAGLRPLLAGQADSTADLSRKHAILAGEDGLLTAVGGKLTTYRRMAQDAVDAALRQPALAGRDAAPCRTARLPLVGAASHAALCSVSAPARLVARYGTEAADVLALAAADPALRAPVTGPGGTIAAELAFALQREGALDAADLLDRRTRIGLVPGDREQAMPVAQAVLERYGEHLPPG
jgi:glycerol-3-phosphate dehydrogenase